MYDQPIVIPPEIKNFTNTPGYRFENTEAWSISFYTDLEIVEDLLPPPLLPTDVKDDSTNSKLAAVSVSFLQYPGPVTTGNGGGPNLDDYSEMVFSIPASYDGAAGRFMSQLYLGSVSPDSAIQPVIGGLVIYGFPKRDARFTRNADEIKIERCGHTIAEAELKSSGLTYDTFPEGIGETINYLKYIPSGVENEQPDVLKLLTTSGGLLQLLAVDPGAQVTVPAGRIVLDTGRVVPIREPIDSSRSVFTFELGWAKELLCYREAGATR